MVMAYRNNIVKEEVRDLSNHYIQPLHLFYVLFKKSRRQAHLFNNLHSFLSDDGMYRHETSIPFTSYILSLEYKWRIMFVLSE